MVQLGGNINVDGFETVSRNDFVIVKKLVGSFVKTVSDKYPTFKNCNLILVNPEKEKNDEFQLRLSLGLDQEFSAEVNDSNLYFAFNKVCKEIEGKLP